MTNTPTQTKNMSSSKKRNQNTQQTETSGVFDILMEKGLYPRQEHTTLTEEEKNSLRKPLNAHWVVMEE